MHGEIVAYFILTFFRPVLSGNRGLSAVKQPAICSPSWAVSFRALQTRQSRTPAELRGCVCVSFRKEAGNGHSINDEHQLGF